MKRLALFATALLTVAMTSAAQQLPPAPAHAAPAQLRRQVPLPKPERDVVIVVRPEEEPEATLSAFGGANWLMFPEEQQMRAPMAAPTPETRPRTPDLGKWWKNSEVVAELQLTPAQITQIEQTFLDHRLKLIDLRADVERQEAKLQPLIEADQPDEAKVGAQLDLLLAARGRLEKANAMMMLSIRRILSVEQWKKLEDFKQEREMHFKVRPEHREPGAGELERRPMPAKPLPTRPPDNDKP